MQASCESYVSRCQILLGYAEKFDRRKQKLKKDVMPNKIAAETICCQIKELPFGKTMVALSIMRVAQHNRQEGATVCQNSPMVELEELEKVHL